MFIEICSSTVSSSEQSRGVTYMSWQPAYACVNGIEYLYQQFAKLLHAVSPGFVSLKSVS
jgi:hypothetical protein